MEQNEDRLVEESKTEQNVIDENETNMASLLEQEGLEIDFPKRGEVRQGMVASISPGQILVSVGTKSEGIISGKELDAVPEEELSALKVGQEIPVFVVNPEDHNGNLVLSLTRAREEQAWKTAEDLMESKGVIHSKVISFNKGGLLVPFEGLRGFVPASQISLSRRANMSGETPEQRWASMVGDEIDVRVIEVDRERRRLILSERAASTETRESLKDKVLAELAVGDVCEGRVTSLADFGAFVNISGADGLVHLSEVSWEKIKHPSEVLKVGDDVNVKVIAIDLEKRRIGLSIRQLQDDPWFENVAEYQVGQLIEGTITRLTKFGAFARLKDDLEGLIHISEISEKRIEHPKEVLKEDEVATLRIIKIDPENHRVGLSLRRVDSMAFADMDWQMLLDDDLLSDLGEEKESVVEDTAEEVVAAPEIKESEAAVEVETVVEETTEEAEAAVEVEAVVEEVVEETTEEVEAAVEVEAVVEEVVEETTEEAVEEETEE
ncbi:MAG: S1 RNA-binding domain-containing protein [Anaerolineaceae bacterium]|nr:S1 RNA-binding domain-containing protein [Anaerolineaceae bacterium]